jgi:hypothetical protein
MTDGLGRTGVGVGLDAGRGRQEQLIFDPSTSAVLEKRTVITDAKAAAGQSPFVVQSPLPDGTLTSFKIFVSTGVVDSNVAVPQSTTP